MKFTITAAATLLASVAFAAAPANAQMSGISVEPPPPPAAKRAQKPDPEAQAAAENPNAIKTHAPKVSGGAGKAIQELQNAVKANDPAAIATALAAAQAAAKTADDRYAIGIVQLQAAATAKDQAGIAAGLEAMLASGSVTEDEKYSLYINLAKSYAAANQNDRASQAYQQALQLNPNSVDATAGMAEAMAARGQAAEAVSLLEKGIQLQSAGGARAPEAWYKRAVAIAYKAKIPATVELSRKWVAAYPNADSWQNSLAIYENSTQLDEGRTLDLLRLKRAVGTLTASDYFKFADIAVRKGYSGEAKAVLDEGFAANKAKRSDASFGQLYTLASQRTKGDRESLPAAPGAGTAARQIVNTGDAYFGYGDYAKAAEFYRAALAGQGADANLVNLHLGMALARQGDKAGATAALNAVGGPQAELAKYWLLYLSTKA